MAYTIAGYKTCMITFAFSNSHLSLRVGNGLVMLVDAKKETAGPARRFFQQYMKDMVVTESG